MRTATAKATAILDSGLWRAGIMIACALISFAWYFPGRLTPDSTWQLQQAISGDLTDGNPPIMSVLWRLLLNVAPGPTPMLAVQLGLYWIGVWALWDAVAREGDWRSFAPLVAAIHPLALVLIGVVLKDTVMASALIAGFGIIFRQRSLGRRSNWTVTVFAAAAFTYAALVRWNSVAALAPLLVYWLRPDWLRISRVTLVTVLLGLIAFPLASFVNHSLLRAAPAHLEASLEIFDLAGIAHYSGDRDVLTVPPGCYTPFYWDRLNTPACGFQFERLTGASEFGATDARPEGLHRRWMQAIARHPVAYAWHRLRHFNDSIYFLVPPGLVCREAPEYPACRQPRAKVVLDDFLKKNAVYWPCLWLAAGAWLVFASAASAGPRALAWSGIFYGLGFLAVGLGTEWRYHFWTVLAISMALALHLAWDRADARHFARLLLFVIPVALAGYAARFLYLAMGW